MGSDRRPERGRQPDRPPVAADRGNLDRRGDKQGVAAFHILREEDRRAADLLDPRLDDEHVVQARRREVIQRRMAHDEGRAVGLTPLLVFGTKKTHHFRARAFDEFQIVGVIDDARSIRIFVIDADEKAVNAGLEPA